MHMEASFISPDTRGGLPPQARAQLQAAEGMAVARMQQPHTRRMCLAAAKLDNFLNLYHGGKCHPARLRRISSVLEVTGTCSTPNGEMLEHSIMTAETSKTLTGHSEQAGPPGGTGAKGNVDLTGQWLGAARSTRDDDPD
jgi:hypothetical protein